MSTPLAIYDGDDLLFLNHPSPSPERPEQLVAATCLEINGVKTATIPAEMYSDAQALIPLVYHECFHVYQEIGHFQFSRQFDFFRALAFYPELDSAYRVLCHAEAQIHNGAELTLQDKGVRLAALARHRYQILAEREGLLAFEKDSERREGTAFFVEQKARFQCRRL